AGEQLERTADVLVTVVARLLDEDRLVDARRLEFPHRVAHLIGRADPSAAARPGELTATEGIPHVGAAGDVRTQEVVVREREAEELEALETAAERLVGIVVA